MFYTILFVHIVLCIVLVGLVLMQQGKGADMGAAFGGNSSSLFGAGGATDFVTKLTTSLAIAFMVTSILLVRVYTSYSHSGSLSVSNPLEGSVIKPEAPMPEAPPVSAAQPVANVPAVNVPPQVPVDAKPVEAKPIEAKPVENKPVENKPVDKK